MALTCKSTRVHLAARPTASRMRRTVITASAQNPEVTRRSALGAALAGALVLLPNHASHAAYGDPANIFGKVTSTSGFIPYVGEGYALLLPSRWNPSSEKDLPGVALRYADNTFGGANNVTVFVRKSDKRSIEDFGTPEQWLASQTNLFGATTFSAPDAAGEGSFAPGKFAAVSLLEQSTEKDKKGKTYYKYELLTRTADGTEGGKHVLVAAAVGSDSNLYIVRVSAGEKRWFRGQDKEAYGIFNSFTVA